jgi:hypothetical protein
MSIDVGAPEESMPGRKRQTNKLLQDVWLLLPSFLLLAMLLFAVTALIFLAQGLPSFIENYELFRQWTE